MITCQFEDGGKTSLRHICVNAIIINKGKVLLGKRGTQNNGKSILEAGKWALIGGFFSRDETLEEGLKREVMEESGWRIDNLLLFRINDNPNRPAEDRQNVDMIFVAQAKEKVAGSDEEVTNLEWFDLNTLPPKDQIAFDHGNHLEIYKRYLKENFPLPLFGNITK